MKEIGEAAERVNEVCYAVGGIARDCALDYPAKDIDLVCTDTEKVISSLQKVRNERGEEKIGVSPLTRQLTRVVRIDGEDVDFAQARKETYSGKSIKPEEIEKSTIMEDIMRRDFTVNTLMLELRSDKFLEVKDLTGRGLRDLEDRVLVTPRDPETTFRDDPSRMLRLVRFMSCKNFDVPKEIEEVVKENAGEIHRIPWEKFHEELTRGGVCESYFANLGELGLIDEIMPEVSAMKGIEQPREHHKYDVYKHTMKVVDNLPPNLKFAGLLHDIGKPEAIKRSGTFHGHEKLSEEITERIMKRLKFSNKEIDETKRIVRHHMEPLFLINSNPSDKAIRRFIARNDDIVDDLLAFTRADILASGVHVEDDIEKLNDLKNRIEKLRNEGAGRVKKLALNGHDVMLMKGIKPGVEVGKILDYLREKVELGEVDNNPIELKRLVLNY